MNFLNLQKKIKIKYLLFLLNNNNINKTNTFSDENVKIQKDKSFQRVELFEFQFLNFFFENSLKRFYHTDKNVPFESEKSFQSRLLIIA